MIFLLYSSNFFLGTGFVRSEGVSMVFLQKSVDARRIYCTIVGTRTGGEGFKEKGMTRTSGVAQAKFLHLCYEEAGLSPLKISHVEAHGAGTKVCWFTMGRYDYPH